MGLTPELNSTTANFYKMAAASQYGGEIVIVEDSVCRMSVADGKQDNVQGEEDAVVSSDAGGVRNE